MGSIVQMVDQIAPSDNSDSKDKRMLIAAIDDLSDDSLLDIFHHCRPIISDEDFVGIKCDDERWWYKIAQVCRRWRQLLLASADHLNLCLFFTYGMPTADMLAHFPSFSLVIDYGDEEREVTTQDEEGIMLALRYHHHVCHLRLCMPISSIQRLVLLLDGEFPVLRYLHLDPLTSDDSGLSLPCTFNAPRLHHFILRNVTYNSAGTFHLPLHSSPIQPIGPINEYAQSSGPLLWRSPERFIHTLDDDSLLSIFYVFQPAPLNMHHLQSVSQQPPEQWFCELWWYKLAHVCRRWRYLILASASYLRLSLLCTPGMPVADMLTHSPPLLLIIDHLNYGYTMEEDEQGIMLALQLRNRVRRIRLAMYVTDLELKNLMVALDGEFPMLEYLHISLETDNLGFTLPNAFQAPRLRQLITGNPSALIRSPLLTTSVDLVALELWDIHHDELLRLLSLLPQLEALDITITWQRRPLLPVHDTETQLLDAPIMTQVTLPNLRVFAFVGDADHLEELLHGITAPLLERLEIRFFNKSDFSVPHLLQFMGATENNLGFGSTKFYFHQNVVRIKAYPHHGATMFNFSLAIGEKYLDSMVSVAARISHSLRTMFSTVEHLFLEIQWQQRKFSHIVPSHNLWRRLFRLFSNAKTLHVDVDDEFGGEISRSLLAEDGESAMETLPELEVLQYNTARRIQGKVFDPFIDTRNCAGRPVTLVPL